MNKKSHQEQRGLARVKLPQRHQVEMRFFSLDEMVREDHLVRTVVAYVDSLDLSDLYDSIKATQGNVGRHSIDPRILFSLWLFATLDGVKHGRRIARLVERDLIYMWICGGVSVNYHTICDFRTQHAELLERLLLDSVSVLQYHGLIELRTIAQDGMRVRASAGSGSFRTLDSLETARDEAQAYLDQLNQQDDESPDDRDDEDSDQPSPGQLSARRRAARERLDRLEAACQQGEDLMQKWNQRNSGKSEKHRASEPRVSTTDPESRRMKMADGGFRPAMNVQFANDADKLVILGVEVSQSGQDAPELQPMYERIKRDYGVVPESALVDGGFNGKEGITHLEKSGTACYSRLFQEKKQLAEGKDPYAPRRGDNEFYRAFRKRMGTPEAQEKYKQRAAAAEFPNAVSRNHGLSQFVVRGLAKARAATLWYAIAYNFRRFMSLSDETRSQSYLEILMTS